MRHWIISTSNDYCFETRLSMIKALRPILKELDLGGLKQAKEFVCGENGLEVHAPQSASRIIHFCDEQGLVLTIFTVVTRLITPVEYKRLEVG